MDRDNRITEIGYDGDVHKVSYVYDELGRIESRVAECGADAGKNTVTYGYVPSTAYTTKGTGTTNLIQSITQNGINFAYEYDSRGNIISETRNGVTTTYEYDALGQLIRVNDPHENATWVYTYDCGGNILSKSRYAYTTGAVGAVEETIPYSYGDSNWKDKLTNFNGNEITYDDIGNPLSDGIWTYTWEKGRQLKVIEREDTWVEFKYDHNGMRTQKVVQQDWYPVTTNYTWHGKLLTHMTVDYHDWDEVAQQDVLHFYYDAQKRPAKVKFNGTIYYLTCCVWMDEQHLLFVDADGELKVFDVDSKEISELRFGESLDIRIKAPRTNICFDAITECLALQNMIR